MDEFRKAELTDRVTKAVGLRNTTSAMRAGQGEKPLVVVTCLGPGRCHIPGSEMTGTTCPFCVNLPAYIAEKDIPQFINRVASGN